MESNFIYDRPVSGRSHLGRKAEAEALAGLLSSGGSAAIYEPSKSGKTSLVRQAIFDMKVSGIAVSAVEVSLLSTRSLSEMAAVMQAAMRKAFPDFFAGAAGGFVAGPAGGSGASVSAEEAVREAFSLPFIVAQARGHRIVVVLDEFQNACLAGDGHTDGAKLVSDTIKKATPEQRALCSWVFCGSQVNAMKNIFEYGRAFTHLCSRLRLSPLGVDELTEHIVKGLLSGGKIIDKARVRSICLELGCSAWYLNHFAAICDSLTRGYVLEPVVEQALDTLLAVHEPRFVAAVSDLTDFQVQFLRAVLDGCERFSSAEAIARYGFNSSANVRRIKDALCKKEILTFEAGDKAVILDPLFEFWLKNRFFLENCK